MFDACLQGGPDHAITGETNFQSAQEASRLHHLPRETVQMQGDDLDFEDVMIERFTGAGGPEFTGEGRFLLWADLPGR